MEQECLVHFYLSMHMLGSYYFPSLVLAPHYFLSVILPSYYLLSQILSPLLLLYLLLFFPIAFYPKYTVAGPSDHCIGTLLQSILKKVTYNATFELSELNV